MKTAAEYRKHAEECRVLAKQVPEGEHREQLLEMARTWDNLAKDREQLVRCLVAERCWDQVRCAIEEYTWRFDGLRRRASHRRRT